MINMRYAEKLIIIRRIVGTKTVKKTVNPEFGESWECVVDMVQSQMLDIEVWDQDQGKDDDFMGRARVPIHVLAERGVSDLWVSLEEATSGQVRRSEKNI